MILIELEIVNLNKKKDFRVNENTMTFQVISDLVDVICRSEQCELTGNQDDFVLWNVSSGKYLRNDFTLKENGVKGGEQLMLI